MVNGDAVLVVDVPSAVVCQYQVSPVGAVPGKLTVTPVLAHCGELDNGAGGVAGRACTVRADVVLLQPVEDCVYVKVDAPAVSAVTSPVVALMVATAVLLLSQVPPVAGLRVRVPPAQRELLGIFTTGRALTVQLARVV